MENLHIDEQYELSFLKDQHKLKKIIRDGAYGFGHPCFSEFAKIKKEQDEFMQKPFEVEEGIFTCTACGSKKTLSYAKQVRSCDEGMSVFVTCIKCKNSWQHSG